MRRTNHRPQAPRRSRSALKVVLQLPGADEWDAWLAAGGKSGFLSVLWRHVARCELFHHRQPLLPVLPVGEIVRQAFDPEIALMFVSSVALLTVRLEKWLHRSR